ARASGHLPHRRLRRQRGGAFPANPRAPRQVREKMSELFAKLETPVMKGLEVRWPHGVQAESWPARIPDLYAGEPLVLTAALDKLQGDLQISGERDGQLRQATVPLARAPTGEGIAGEGIAPVWAREKVASLMDA